jgi:hypothetical protein
MTVRWCDKDSNKFSNDIKAIKPYHHKEGWEHNLFCGKLAGFLTLGNDVCEK